MNVLYLLKTLETNKLSELVAAMDMVPLDMNIAIWDAIDRGEIEVDEKKDRVKPLLTWEYWHDPELASKIMRVLEQYTRNKSNITVGRLNSYMKEPVTNSGYKLHEYLMTTQYLIDTGKILEHVVSVPKTPKRPYHKFVFLCLPGNDNEEWNAASVNKWIAEFEKIR